jgi:hypothetical protein
MIEAWRRPASLLVLGLLGVVATPVPAIVAQDSTVTIDVGAEALPPPTLVAIPDSVLRRALDRFNDPTTSKVFGGSQFPADLDGTLGVYSAAVLVSGHIRGDVVVINGDLRLQSGGRIDGAVIVLGGRFSPDPGAVHPGSVTEYRASASVRLTADYLLVPTQSAPSLRTLAEQAALRFNNVVLTPHLGVGVYNRVEGLPIEVGPALTWTDGDRLSLRAAADLIIRTSRDPSGTRSRTGWHGRVALSRDGAEPLVVGLEGGNRIVPTADSILSPTESSLNTLLFRRDYRDWFGQTGASAFVSWRPAVPLTLTARAGWYRENSQAVSSPFSVLRESSPWRQNPLIDDGKFTVIALEARWSQWDAPGAPRDGWQAAVGVRRTGSNEITPVQLPSQVRDPLPTSGYAAFEASFDLRRIQRIDPRNALHVRFAGRGWIGGDPLTMQRRLALNGADPFAGYAFRSVTCDPRRRIDPSVPALCDRQMMVQAEFRRTVDLHLGTQLGPYGFGIERADLLLLADFGSAWIAGDGPGQVPAGSIQSLNEWRADIGAGIDAGWIGAYLARSLTEDGPVRLSFRLQRRF